MPRLRKLTSEEVRAIERREGPPRPAVPPAEDLPLLPFLPGEDEGLALGDSDSGHAPAARPRIGDVVRILQSGAPSGIVLRVHDQNDGTWSAAEVLIDGRRYLLPAPLIEAVVGRPRGISRIDQPSHRTHGWFVRIYDGKLPRIARMFSDRSYGGIAAALNAALAFHAEEDR